MYVLFCPGSCSHSCFWGPKALLNFLIRFYVIISYININIEINICLIININIYIYLFYDI